MPLFIQNPIVSNNTINQIEEIGKGLVLNFLSGYSLPLSIKAELNKLKYFKQIIESICHSNIYADAGFLSLTGKELIRCENLTKITVPMRLEANQRLRRLFSEIKSDYHYK
jgi:hypothetical protein